MKSIDDNLIHEAVRGCSADARRTRRTQGVAMRVRNSRDLGALARDRRKELRWSQTELAERLGTSRSWISEMENGKERAEVGLVLKALQVLGLEVNVHGSTAVKTLSPEPIHADYSGVLLNWAGLVAEPHDERPALTRRGKSLSIARPLRQRRRDGA